MIANIIKNSKQKDRNHNTTNSDSKTNLSLSFNQEGSSNKGDKEHVQDSKEETRLNFKCKEVEYVSSNCTATTKPNGDQLNTLEQCKVL